MKRKIIFLALILQILFLIQLFPQTPNSRFLLIYYDLSIQSTPINTMTQEYKNMQADYFNCAITWFRLTRATTWAVDPLKFQYAYSNPSKTFMDSAYKYGINILLTTPDNSVQRLKQPCCSFVTQYDSDTCQAGLDYWGNHPALLGFEIMDEPYTLDDVSLIIPYANHIRNSTPNLLRSVNLPPICCGGSDYEQFIQDYIDTIKPNILSFDNYPIFEEHTPPKPDWYNDLFHNLDIMSRKSVANNIPFIYVLSSRQHIYINDTAVNARMLSERATSYFMYAGLCYGAKGLAHWNSTYRLSHFSSAHRELTRSINKKIIDNEEVLLSLQFHSAYHKNTVSTIRSGLDSIPSHAKWQNFSSDPLANEIFDVSNPFIALPGSAIDSLVVSFLTDNIGNRYFWIFNKSLSSSENVQLNLRDGNSVMDVLNSIPCLLKNAAIHLEPAEAKLFKLISGQHTSPIQTITTNTIWESKRIISEKIVIEPSVVLTITDIVLFGANASITIKPGAKLVVDGGTLTNACTDKMWYGILISGNGILPQTPQNQGTLELKNGAVIENAKNAIATYELRSNGDTDWNSFGGIIRAENTTFKNNRRSVEFMKYPPDGTNPVRSNVSYFNNCTFIVDDNNLFASNNTTFNDHITMWGVSGVKIRGCEFKNNITNMGNRGKAIGALDAGYTIDEHCPVAVPTGICECSVTATPSVFSGFNNAIASTNSAKQYAISIDRSKFRDNHTGISLTGINSFQLSRLNMKLNTPYTQLPTGIYLDNCTYYNVEDNTIFSIYNNDLSTGIWVDNPGMDENRIYRNTISETYYGIKVPQQKNNTYFSFPSTGLQFICNDFNRNGYDIAVILPGVIRATQGSTVAGADNLFSSPRAISFFVNNPIWQINYHYDPFVSRKFSHTTSSNITPSQAIANPCRNTLCPKNRGESLAKFSESLLDEYRELNHKFAEMMSHFYAKGYDQILTDYYNGIIENEKLLKEAIAYHEEILAVTEYMAEVSNETLFALKIDSIIDLNKIRDWYDEMYNLSAKYSLAETYYQLGKFEEGYHTLSLIPKMYDLSEDETTEHNNYVSLFTFKNEIQKSGRTIAQLNEKEIEQMIYFASASYGLSSLMAQGILCFFYEICFEKEEDKKQKGEKEKGERNSIETINPRQSVTSVSSACSKTLENITLVPNPTTGELIIKNIESRIIDIEVFDVYGRKVSSHHQITSSSQQKINLSHLNCGIYFVKIITAEGEVVKKIVKQ